MPIPDDTNPGPTFYELVHQNEQWIYRTLLRLGCDPEQAEDLTQETFLRAYRMFPNLPGAGAYRTRLLSLALAIYRETEQ